MGKRIFYLALLLGGVAFVPAARAQDPSPSNTPAPAPAGLGNPEPASAPVPPELPPQWTVDPLLITRGQDYAPPDPVFPLPLYSTRPENGGMYAALSFLYLKENDPIRNQVVAVRGFYDIDGSIDKALGLPGGPGTFIGSGAPALTTGNMSPSTFSDGGFEMTVGWRFRSGFAFEVDWLWLNKTKTDAGASIIPFGFNSGNLLQNTFITAPVFNVTPEFAGPGQKLAVGAPGATFGIWNAATTMTEQFTQEFSQYDFRGRMPVFQTDDVRVYGIGGARIVHLRDHYWWRTVSVDTGGNSGPFDAANYTDTVTNNLYGPMIGGGCDWRLCDTPAGTFAVSCDLIAALMADFDKVEAKYERADRDTSTKLTRRGLNLVPELQAQPNIWWYPIEGVQLRAGYDIFSFFNTVMTPYPVNFNLLVPEPAINSATRLFNGMHAGIAIIF